MSSPPSKRKPPRRTAKPPIGNFLPTVLLTEYIFHLKGGIITSYSNRICNSYRYLSDSHYFSVALGPAIVAANVVQRQFYQSDCPKTLRFKLLAQTELSLLLSCENHVCVN